MTSPFTLQRVYAFTVSPQRLAGDDGAEQNGGPVKLTPEVREVIEKAFTRIASGTLTRIDLNLDAERQHEVRDHVMQLAFGATQAPRAAAGRLATRLSRAMDGRSHSALLLLAVESSEQMRRVSLLLFPREDVVQLNGSAEDVLLNVLRNAFSTASGIRKLARFTGKELQTHFLSAEVLDFQLSSSHKETADFWIVRFLNGKAPIDSKTGTKLLAAALQRAFDAADSDGRDAVFAAMFGTSSGGVRKTSLSKVAASLPVGLRDAFFSGVANDETRDTIFDVDRDIAKEMLARRVITGKDGVILSAPAETVGRSVSLSQGGKSRVVSYSGMVVSDRVMKGRRKKPK